MIRMLLLAVALVAVVAFGVAFFAGKTFIHSPGPPSVAASSKVECEATGSNLNALLDTERSSPNIARATAEFDRGVAKCMWGRFAGAKEHYKQAYSLLRG